MHGTQVHQDIESENLAAHVRICEVRYQALDARLGSLETKLDHVYQEIARVRHQFNKTLIASAGSIIVAIIGAAAMVVGKL